MDSNTIILLVIVLAVIGGVYMLVTKSDKNDDAIGTARPRTPQEMGKPPYSDEGDTL